ncbi:MAG TPA: DUF5107 domain-containing protein [Candidatus Hydrogenedentes bacterium]|nr:DUF5107 domain-containing protein [Candidatus Hydrogenedentota bacterium]
MRSFFHKQSVVAGLVLAAMFLAAAAPAMAAAVSVREAPLTLPTYGVGPADINPRFYDGRGYQGAMGPVYPYAMLDDLTHERSDRTYTALYLENEYVRIIVLPEIGGRIFEAYDKTNGHHFFYRQNVVKPDLIGMLGAWISGGVEWCVFHHHRNTTFMPVDYRLAENPDGSKTIWIGESERRHRMRWIIGMTLTPGSSRLDVTVKMFNPTPYVHTLLYWANVAIHATDGYQVIFPPSTQFATFHGKNEFSHWPVSFERFHGMDYTQGVDVSWWRSHPSPTSFFAWEAKEDFFAGYDHGLDAGVAHVADHHVVPGMKLWTWGTNSTWDRTRLTDEDGPYAEIMVGAFSDNQPDYSWMQPGEVKVFRQSWYPLRGLGGVCNATIEAAVNLVVTDGTARLGFNTTATHDKARVTLRAGTVSLLDRTVTIGPANPFTAEAALPQGVREEDLRAAVHGQDGRELVAYQKQTYEEEPMPEPVSPPPAPAEIETVEELYLAGQRLQQFYNPSIEPYPYYEEALRRDPDDSRVNTALAIDDCKRGLYERAEERLRRAIARITQNYTRPRDGEPHYYLGVALAGQERYAEAYDAFNRASWNAAWRYAANYALAQIDCRRGDLEEALRHLDEAIGVNARATASLNLRAAALRRLGRYAEAAAQAEAAEAIDPLDFFAANERCLAEGAAGRKRAADRMRESLTARMRDEAESYLELASHYGAVGLYEEAVDVLSRRTGGDDPGSNPMLYYHQGYYTAMLGDAAAANALYATANAKPPEYCFPFRLESIRMLRHAVAARPDDARAYYYLGNLLYDLQPDAAVAAWEASVALDGTLATAHRNLGYAYQKLRDDYAEAIAAYERAVQCDNTDPRVFYELELLNEVAGVAPDKRLAVLTSNQATTDRRSDLVVREIQLFVDTGQYDRAIEMLAGRRFTTWEGGTGAHDTYVEALVLRGMSRLDAGQPADALADFLAALEYPANLGVDRPPHDPQAARTHLLIADAHDALGDAASARAALEAGAAIDVGGSEFRFHKGRALARLGRAEEAKTLFDDLASDGAAQLAKGGEVDFFMKFGERQAHGQRMARAHYLAGLGALGHGDDAAAREQFEKALEANPNHLWARVFLRRLLSGA